MNRTVSLTLKFLSLASLSALALPGCKQGPKGTPESCDKYAEALCEKMSGDQAGCESAKTTVKLMPPNACAAGLADIAFTETKLADQRKGCDELVTKLCKDIGEDTESCAMVREQTPQFPPSRCAQLMENYDKVLADLKKREAANKPLTAEMQAKLADAPNGVFGPKDAKVTMVEFSDFECPYCSRAADTLTQLKTKYADKVRFVFRHFPLSFHPNAHLASQAVIAASEQGKFWELHDLLFKNQKALDRASLEKFAKEVGLDMTAFKKALDAQTHKARVDADMALGGEVGVQGTPTVFINGKRVQNAIDVEAVSAVIDKALAGEG